MPLTQVQGGMILPSTTLTTPIVATTMGVGGATPATTGSGITFPTSQLSSTNANTLDDYEEGTWTPTAFGESTAGTTTYADRNGNYIKIGRLVYARGFINPTGMTGTGTLYIGGLPFLTDVNYPAQGYLMSDALDLPTTGNLTLYASTGSSSMRIFVSTDNVSWQTPNVENSTWALHFTIIYAAVD